MFRFSIRDVLWLTVVVGMATGWAMREQQMRVELGNAMQWRRKAHGLQTILEHEGWQLTWKDNGIVDVINPIESKTVRLDYLTGPDISHQDTTDRR